MVELARYGLLPAAEAAPLLVGAARGVPLHGAVADGVHGIRAFSVVDPEDYARVSRQRWCLSAQRYVVRRGSVDGRRQQVRLHRVLLGLGRGGLEVDHINGDRLDNRRANLRVATRALNGQNLRGRLIHARRPTTSRHRGVSWDASRGKWTVSIMVAGRPYRPGRFDSEEEAARVAAAFRAKHMPFSAEAR